jgi:hypothetical protein
MQRLRVRSALLVGTFALSAALGCSSARQNPPPEDLAVIFGEGGGITGRWQGFTLGPDGSLSEWSGMGITSRSEETKLRTLDDSEMSDLWAKVVELDVLSHADATYGNMTRAIHLTENGATHVFAWPTPVSDATESPAQKLYASCHSVAMGGVR